MPGARVPVGAVGKGVGAFKRKNRETCFPTRSAEEKVLWFEAEVGQAKKRDGALEAWVSVENFLKKMALDFLYEEDHVFLYQSYFLTKYRKFLEEKKGSFIDSELAQKSLLLGTRKTIVLLSFFRENLSMYVSIC